MSTGKLLPDTLLSYTDEHEEYSSRSFQERGKVKQERKWLYGKVASLHTPLRDVEQGSFPVYTATMGGAAWTDIEGKRRLLQPGSCLERGSLPNTKF